MTRRLSAPRSLVALVALACLAHRSEAQAPRITPAGDPSVRSDTIYRLAVSPADHADKESVLLLDDGVVIVEDDGTRSETFRFAVQVLTQEGVERWGEVSLSYQSDRQRLRVNWVRVVDSAGRVISDRPAHQQESLAPVAAGAPVYTSAKVLQMTLSGVAPNTIVDYSYTTETFSPVLPADFNVGWSVTTWTLTRRSRLVVELPARLKPRITERNLGFPARVTERGGRRTYVWATADVPKVEDLEPFAAAESAGVYRSVQVSGAITWQEIARWYAALGAGRDSLTPELEGVLREVVRGAGTLEDSLRAVHRWVAQDFRYVSLSLGIGGYQPRRPAEVLQTRSGDCKDKATLFIAAARRMGVRAYPVLLAQGGGVDTAHPTLEQFDHMIAAAERPGGYLYLDLTSELTPFGALPPSEQGEFALVVHPDGRGETVTLPEDPASANWTHTRLEGELSRDGRFTGSYTQRRGGALQYGLREPLARPLTAEERDRMARALANGLFEGATPDSLHLMNGKDLRAEPRVTLWLRDGRAATASGRTHILTLPLESYADAALVAELQADTQRVYPIDVAAVVGPLEGRAELRLTLPKGWRARLPGGVTAESAFGSYTATYAQRGRELHVVRRMAGRGAGVEPPERIGDLIAWLRAIAADDVRFIVIEH